MVPSGTIALIRREMQEPTEIDLAPFMAAVIDGAGGEIRIPYESFTQQRGERAITIDLEEDGATIVLRLTEEIPNE
jgi:hypothetical protein